jgi:hypothetical protein
VVDLRTNWSGGIERELRRNGLLLATQKSNMWGDSPPQNVVLLEEVLMTSSD